jgi:putative membrane protein
MILRDHLAIDRTILANERTFLAYVRTALALIVAGVSFVKLFDAIPIQVLGWFFIPAGVATLVVGVRRYQRMRVWTPDKYGGEEGAAGPPNGLPH